MFFPKIEHKIFYLDLKTYIAQPNNTTVPKSVSEKNCSLSKFIETQNLNTGKIDSNNKTLIKVHKEIHEIAKKIIQLKEDKKIEEFAEMSTEFEGRGADAIELNFVCPNRGSLVGKPVDETLGRYWSDTPERSYTVIRAIKDIMGIPVWAKFPFEIVSRDPRIVKKMEEAGVDAVVATASVPRAMAINLETGRPILGNPRGSGAVGGRIMKPLGISCVSELSRLLKTDVIGSGGVFNGLDVIEYIMAGARGVEVLTAIMQRVSVQDMLKGIKDFMSQNGYSSLEDFRGKTLEFLPPLSGDI